MCGKTTLDRQLMTKGNVRPIDESNRTHHKKKRLSNKYILPQVTAKRVRSRGLKRTVLSSDVGGHVEYHNLWLRDIFHRNVKTIIVVIDDRHLLDPQNTDNQVAMGYLVDALINRKKPKRLGFWKRFKRRNYTPHRVLLLANKADEWLNDDYSFEMWERGMISHHPIFEAFQQPLYSLQECNIPTRVDACSASIGWNVEEAIIRGIEDT